MKTSTLERLRAGMSPGQYYTSKQIKNMLCSTQSTTAEYLMQDCICAGYLAEGVPAAGNVNRIYRINQ